MATRQGDTARPGDHKRQRPQLGGRRCAKRVLHTYGTMACLLHISRLVKTECNGALNASDKRLVSLSTKTHPFCLCVDRPGIKVVQSDNEPIPTRHFCKHFVRLKRPLFINRNAAWSWVRFYLTTERRRRRPRHRERVRSLPPSPLLEPIISFLRSHFLLARYFATRSDSGCNLFVAVVAICTSRFHPVR